MPLRDYLRERLGPHRPYSRSDIEAVPLIPSKQTESGHFSHASSSSGRETSQLSRPDVAKPARIAAALAKLPHEGLRTPIPDMNINQVNRTSDPVRLRPCLLKRFHHLVQNDQLYGLAALSSSEGWTRGFMALHEQVKRTFEEYSLAFAKSSEHHVNVVRPVSKCEVAKEVLDLLVEIVNYRKTLNRQAKESTQDLAKWHLRYRLLGHCLKQFESDFDALLLEKRGAPPSYDDVAHRGSTRVPFNQLPMLTKGENVLSAPSLPYFHATDVVGWPAINLGAETVENQLEAACKAIKSKSRPDDALHLAFRAARNFHLFICQKEEQRALHPILSRKGEREPQYWKAEDRLYRLYTLLNWPLDMTNMLNRRRYWQLKCFAAVKRAKGYWNGGRPSRP